jgi:ribosome biogenesis GTPase
MPRLDPDDLADAWDEDGPATPRGRPEPSVAARAARRREGVARVVALDRGQVTVVADAGAGGAPFPARYGGALRGARVAVGDRVRVSGGGSGSARLVEVLPRATVLRRTADDLDHRERVVAANADAVAVVVGCDNLAAGLRFADRVLVAAVDGGLEALLVVTKVDLVGTPAGPGDTEELGRALAPYAGAVTEVLRTSVEDGAGLDALRSRLRGRWTVLTGHSGVGKSSLVNAILPAADREIGEVGRRGGRHTTVAARALPVPGGGWIVDTPGVRSFGLGMLDRAALARCFPELATLRCVLADCRHAGEPGCGLPGAGLDPVRAAAFERLAAALEGRGALDEDGADAHGADASADESADESADAAGASDAGTDARSDRG